MIYAGKYDMTVKRWVPFLYTVEFPGFDLTGATMAMQVRAYPDAIGSALLSLVNASSVAEGLSVSVTMDDDDVPTSIVQIRINETTIETIIPPPAGYGECNNNVNLAYDFVMTGGGYPKTRWMQGAFIIEAGVTQ